jgi:hypothetical protein
MALRPLARHNPQPFLCLSRKTGDSSLLIPGSGGGVHAFGSTGCCSPTQSAVWVLVQFSWRKFPRAGRLFHLFTASFFLPCRSLAISIAREQHPVQLSPMPSSIGSSHHQRRHRAGAAMAKRVRASAQLNAKTTLSCGFRRVQYRGQQHGIMRPLIRMHVCLWGVM